MVRFGMWSTILALASVHGLVFAVLLARVRVNRPANRALAGLLVIVVLAMTPYTIGYAGFYDAWPWLTFAPFAWQLAFGPLVWLYVYRLAMGSDPPGLRWHFLPAALQGLYHLVLFVQPLPIKMHWYLGAHAALVVPLQWTLVALSVGGYWLAAWRTFIAWQRWLALHHAAAEEYAARWLRRFLQLTGLVLVTGAGFAAWHVFIAPISYFDAFGLYLVFAVLVDVLGIEGWRHATLAAPHLAAEEAPPSPSGLEGRSTDWAERGHAWAERVRAQEWYRQPDLTVAQLARLLGTNTAYLSRAFNEGVGEPFSAVINRMRVAQACAELELGHGVLVTAMHVGFGSKATFNRVFREVTGMTPTAYRSRHAGRPKTEMDADVTGHGTP